MDQFRSFIISNQNGITVAGFKQGVHYDFYKGILTNYENDYRYGECSGYYTNGMVNFIENYQRGERHGKSMIYYPSGKPKHLANYVSDNINGKSHWWNPDGTYEVNIYLHGTFIRKIDAGDRERERIEHMRASHRFVLTAALAAI